MHHCREIHDPIPIKANLVDLSDIVTQIWLRLWLLAFGFLPSSPLISLSQDDVWLEASRQRSSLPASAHASPDCRGHLHQFSGGSWLRQLLVLVDGCLYIYSDIEPDASATSKSLPITVVQKANISYTN